MWQTYFIAGEKISVLSFLLSVSLRCEQCMFSSAQPSNPVTFRKVSHPHQTLHFPQVCLFPDRGALWNNEMNPLKHLSLTVQVLISQRTKKQINSVFTGLLKKGPAALYGAGFGLQAVNVTPTKIKNSSGKSQTAL